MSFPSELKCPKAGHANPASIIKCNEYFEFETLRSYAFQSIVNLPIIHRYSIDNKDKKNYIIDMAEASISPVINVLFYFHEDGFKHKATFPLTSKISVLKEKLSIDLNVPLKNYSLTYNNQQLNEDKTLDESGPFPSDLDEIMLTVVPVGSTSIRKGRGARVAGARKTHSNEHKDTGTDSEGKEDSGGVYDNEIIEVQIYDDKGNPTRTLAVAIDRSELNNPYLGGYQNKKTGTKFLHAGSQTSLNKKVNNDDIKTKFHRETQTVTLKARSCQTKREQGTQMQRRDVFVDESRDVTVSALPYITSEQLSELKLQKTVVIQSHWRAYLARKHAMKKREEVVDKRRKLEEIQEVKYMDIYDYI